MDFKLELGLNKAGELLLADEISPDTCRFWDQRSGDTNDRIWTKTASARISVGMGPTGRS